MHKIETPQQYNTIAVFSLAKKKEDYKSRT